MNFADVLMIIGASFTAGTVVGFLFAVFLVGLMQGYEQPDDDLEPVYRFGARKP